MIEVVYVILAQHHRRKPSLNPGPSQYESLSWLKGGTQTCQMEVGNVLSNL